MPPCLGEVIEEDREQASRDANQDNIEEGTTAITALVAEADEFLYASLEQRFHFELQGTAQKEPDSAASPALILRRMAAGSDSFWERSDLAITMEDLLLVRTRSGGIVSARAMCGGGSDAGGWKRSSSANVEKNLRGCASSNCVKSKSAGHEDCNRAGCTSSI
jgi:hypothetical protein